MTRATAGRAALAVAAALVAGCATKGNVVLLPEKEGHPAALTVRQGDKEVVLDQPYAAAKLRTTGPGAYVSTQQDVEREFGSALAAQPRGAQRFVLYFVEGTDEFTDESKKLVDDVLADIARRPVPDVLVVGHTDAVGSDQANDALGLQRADTVRRALTQRGIPADDVRAISRGKRAPAIPTPDGVAEPRNRRVEIIVR